MKWQAYRGVCLLETLLEQLLFSVFPRRGSTFSFDATLVIDVQILSDFQKLPPARRLSQYNESNKRYNTIIQFEGTCALWICGGIQSQDTLSLSLGKP